jgi:MFS transporter, NNP family, nitrate/nitrite transporter
VLLVLAFLVGFAGNSFTAGIAWNSAWTPRERQGFALGIFGAGNVGASVTKFIGPSLIAGTRGYERRPRHRGRLAARPGHLRPRCWSLTAVLTWTLVPRGTTGCRASRTLARSSQPLKQVRVWRFSLYYVAVFGAYVALAAWLPKYYIDNFGVSLRRPRLLTATLHLPASLLRPLGGWFSDKWGARRSCTGPSA